MKIVERESVGVVKGMSIKFIEKIKIDESTGNEIYDTELEQQNDMTLFNEYRKINGLLFPEEIKAIRERLGVSQVRFSQMLGLEDNEIIRFENGSLQDEYQDKLIRAVEERRN